LFKVQFIPSQPKNLVSFNVEIPSELESVVVIMMYQTSENY